jgi:hypothetical protein
MAHKRSEPNYHGAENWMGLFFTSVLRQSSKPGEKMGRNAMMDEDGVW